MAGIGIPSGATRPTGGSFGSLNSFADFSILEILHQPRDIAMCPMAPLKRTWFGKRILIHRRYNNIVAPARG